jgi:DNA polymerase III subunit beta
MEFIIAKDVFLESLSKVQYIVERKTTLAILSNVMLEARNSSLTVSATDLELGFQGIYDAEIHQEGVITVPARKLYEIIKEFPSESVFIQSKDSNSIFISTEEVKYTLYGLPAEDFPGLPEISNVSEIGIEAQKLRKMIQCTIFSTSNEDTMYNTSGIYLEKCNNNGNMFLRMVSTDGHRLSKIDEQIADIETLNFREGIVISKKAISEISRLIEREEKVSIGFSEKIGIVRTEKNVLIIRLLENKFPDYKKVIPESASNKARIKRLPFIDMLRRMSIFTNERHRAIRLDFRPDLLEIFSTNPDVGDSREQKKIDYNGREMSIGFNPRYITDALMVMESEEIQMELMDENSGCVLSGEMDQGFMALIMPMKLL